MRVAERMKFGVPEIMVGRPRGAVWRAEARAACIEAAGFSFTGPEGGRTAGEVEIAAAVAIACPEKLPEPPMQLEKAGEQVLLSPVGKEKLSVILLQTKRIARPSRQVGAVGALLLSSCSP